MNPLVDIYTRLLSDNPTLFKVIMWLSIGAAFIVKIPAWLVELNITVPEVLVTPYSNILAGAAVIIALIAKLPNKEVVAVTTETKVTEKVTEITPKISE